MPDDDRVRRANLIKKIEQSRGSRLLVYVTGDRQGVPVQIAEDAVRPMYVHLLSFAQDNSGMPDKIDLLLYSRGGAVEVPWRIVSMVREFCKQFAVLVPYKAHSAATMVALGADVIVLGPKGELGPIDPSTNLLREVQAPQGVVQVPDSVNVEDLMAFVDFLKSRVGLTDQAGLSSLLEVLIHSLHPWVVGGMYRTHAHIDLVARKLLDRRNTKISEAQANAIIKTLVEETYLHGHAIGRREAKDLGLPIAEPDSELEQLLWEVYLEYERMLRLGEPIDVNTFVPKGQDEHAEPDCVLAVIESREMLHDYKANLVGRAVRQLPANLNLTINVNVQPPVGGPQPAQQQVQQLQQILNQLQQEIAQQVNQQLRSQAPIVRREFRIEDGRWDRAI